MNTTPGTTFKIQLSAWGLVDDEALLMIIADEQAKEISSLNSVNWLQIISVLDWKKKMTLFPSLFQKS